MEFAEITIGVLLGVLVIVGSIYLTYFLYTAYKKRKELKKEGEKIEIDSKKSKIAEVLLFIYFGLAIFMLAINITYRASPYIDGKYYVSVNTTSMSAPLSTNAYLQNNSLTNQIKQYEIVCFDKLEDQEIKLYDIILFKKDNKLIVHRIVEITEDGYFTKGDNNAERDDWTVARVEILGIYKKKLHFMSAINYFGYTPGFYVLMVGATYCLGTFLFFEYKNKKLISD